MQERYKRNQVVSEETVKPSETLLYYFTSFVCYMEIVSLDILEISGATYYHNYVCYFVTND